MDSSVRRAACLTVFANCLVKQTAPCLGVIVILSLNVMEVFSVGGGVLRVIPRTPPPQIMCVSCLWSQCSMTTSFFGTPLTTFMDATEVEIRNIIKLSHAQPCALDPLPTWLLKECIAELVPTIAAIVNMSLRDSLMPKSLKTALIRPLSKKTGLDSDINYRPISNLTFISKVIEKMVSGRLNEHLIKYSMFDPLQSAYRDKHYTETALIKV